MPGLCPDVVDTLLGPERTDVLSRQDNDEADSSVIPPGSLGLVLSWGSVLCVV